MAPLKELVWNRHPSSKWRTCHVRTICESACVWNTFLKFPNWNLKSARSPLDTSNSDSFGDSLEIWQRTTKNTHLFAPTTQHNPPHESARNARKVCPISLLQRLPNAKTFLRRKAFFYAPASKPAANQLILLEAETSISQRTKAHEIQLQKTPKSCQFLRNLLFPLSIPLWEPFPRQKL